MKTNTFFSKNVHLQYLKIALFIAIVYGIYPYFFTLIFQWKALFYFNNFSFAGYSLLLMALYFISIRKELHSTKNNLSWKGISIYSSLSAACFGLTLFLRYYLTPHSPSMPLLFTLSVFTFLVAVFLLFIAFFGTTLIKKTYDSLLIYITIVIIYYVFTQVLWSFWDVLARYVSTLTSVFLSLLSSDVSLIINAGDPTLSIEGFSVVVGKPCSGVESISMFLALFLLLIIYERNNLNWKRTIILGIVGIIGAFLLNIIRISLIMVIGTKYPEFALSTFHSQAGWFLFSLFILALLFFSYRWIRKGGTVGTFLSGKK